MSIVNYIITMGLTSKLNGFVPTEMDAFLDWLDKNEINIWSYCEEDISEIEDMAKVVLVQDIKGKKRYFEMEITETY